MPFTSKYKLGGDDDRGNRAALPIKLAVGRQNIRVSETGSAAALGRGLNTAFTQLAQDFRAFVNRLEDVLPEDMKAAVEPTFELSQYYCPVKTGELKSSGYITIEGFRGGARVEVGYGKYGLPPYAIQVHELPYRHEPPTRYKWLEAAFDEDYYNILQRVADNVSYRIR